METIGVSSGHPVRAKSRVCFSRAFLIAAPPTLIRQSFLITGIGGPSVQNDQQTCVTVFITCTINKSAVKQWGGSDQHRAHSVGTRTVQENVMTTLFFFKPAVPFIANIGNVIPRVFFLTLFKLMFINFLYLMTLRSFPYQTNNCVQVSLAFTNVCEIFPLSSHSIDDNTSARHIHIFTHTHTHTHTHTYIYIVDALVIEEWITSLGGGLRSLKALICLCTIAITLKYPPLQKAVLLQFEP